MTTMVVDDAGQQAQGDHQVLFLGDVVLQCGVTLRDARLAFKTYGGLNATRSNAVLMPTYIGGQHADTEIMMAPGRALDPAKFFVIVPNMLGNGLSSSPSNTPAPLDGPSFPTVTMYDNVVCQHRLVTEHLGIEHLRLVVGFSSGAQQAFHWGAIYPDIMDAIAPICGTARASHHYRLLISTAEAALTTAGDFEGGWYREPPVRGLLALSRVWRCFAYTSDFYRKHEYTKLDLASPEDTGRFFEGWFRRRDANDLVAMLRTAQSSDISANDVYRGDLSAALAAIGARAMVMPSATDHQSQVGDSEFEVGQMPNAELRIIPSIWGHAAGFGANPTDNEFIDRALDELLAK